MTVKVGEKIAGVILIIGSLSSALSRWYLVWIAQKLGGTEELGIYGMLFAIATPLFVASQLGLRTIFLSKKQAFPLRSYYLLRTIGIVVGSVILLLFVLQHPVVPISLGLAVLAMKVFDAIIDFNLARLQYANKILSIALITVFVSLLSFSASTVAALSFKSLSAAVLGSALASLVAAFWTYRMANSISYPKSTTQSGIGSILRASVPVTGAELLASLLLYLPILVLGFSSSITAVGIFTGLSYVLIAADLIGSTLSRILITPMRVVAKEEGYRSVIRRSNLLTRRTLLLSLPFAALFVGTGPSILQWIYGPEFLLSNTVLILFAGASVFVILSHIQAVCLNVLNQYSKVMHSFGVACVLALFCGAFLLFLNADPLVVGSSMVAAGAFGRALTMFVGVVSSNSVS